MIVVDQLRFPQWFSPDPERRRPAAEPRSACARARSPSARHYTASNDCTPARSALLTGLYTHQTGCMITGGSTLDPGFPTWGTMLREHGYHTRWYGKWHLTHHDNMWTAGARAGRARATTASRAAPSPRPTAAPARAGASTRTSRAVSSHELVRQQPRARQAASRGARRSRSSIPHDIAWWYEWSDRVPAEAQAPRVIGRAAAQLRDAGAADRAQQAAAAALLAGHRGRLVRARCRSPAPKRPQLAAVPRPLREAPARGRPPHRPGPAHARKPPRGRGEHGDRVHLRPRRVRRLARPARQGRQRLRGGASACR